MLENGSPKPVAVRLGLTDGTTTELLQSPLAEGAEVIIGTQDGRAGKNEPAGGGLPRGRFF